MVLKHFYKFVDTALFKRRNLIPSSCVWAGHSDLLLHKQNMAEVIVYDFRD